MDPNRQYWNEQQKRFDQALQHKQDHAQALDLFLNQHAMVHTARAFQAGLWSFDDEVWEGLSDAAARRVPQGFVHSIAWMLWHTARCEDITLNILVAGGEQVLVSGGWLEKLNIVACDTGSEMSEVELAAFNSDIELHALRDYRLAVAQRTREIVQQIQPGGFQHKVLPERVPRLLAEGAVVPAANYLVEYWSGRTTGGLLRMPATRHHMVHFNECLRLKKKK